MKIKVFIYSNIYILISVISLLFIRHYQVNSYNMRFTPLTLILDKIYEYISIPSFYFFLSAYITTVVMIYLKINLPKIISNVFKVTVGFILLIFVGYIIINKIGIISIHYLNFVSIYSYIFSIIGCLFALSFKHKYE